MLLSTVDGKLKQMKDNPECVQNYAKELQTKLAEGESLGGIIKEQLKSYVGNKLGETIWPVLEPVASAEPFMLELEDLLALLTDLEGKSKDIKRCIAHPKDFLLEKRSFIVWLRLKPFAEAQKVEWSQLQPQVDMKIEEKDSFKDVVIEAAQSPEAFLAELLEASGVLHKIDVLSMPAGGGTLRDVNVTYGLADGEEDVDTEFDNLACVTVQVPEADIKCYEMTRVGNEELFESADAWMRSVGDPSKAKDGPLLQLTPHGCHFDPRPIEICFDVAELLQDYDGPACFVLRRKETLTDNTSWTALAHDERLTITEDGRVVIKLRSLCWLKCWYFQLDEDGGEVIAKLMAKAFDEVGQTLIDAEQADRQNLVGIDPGETGYKTEGIAAVNIAHPGGKIKVTENIELATSTARTAADEYADQGSDAPENQKTTSSSFNEQQNSELDKELLKVCKEGTPGEMQDLEVAKLVREGANPNAKDEHGFPALCSAVWDHRMVRELLSLKADVNATSSNGTTALMGAAMEGHTESVQMLLTAGDVAVDMANDEKAETALMLAVASAAKLSESVECARALSDAGADGHSLQDSSGMTAIDRARQMKEDTESIRARKRLDKIIAVLDDDRDG